VASKILRSCRVIEPGFQVEEDRSPVMEGPGMFLAQVRHRSSTIVLNGHALDRSPRPALLRKFLVVHELFHVWLQETRGGAVDPTWNLGEEDLADAVAFFALK